MLLGFTTPSRRENKQQRVKDDTRLWEGISETEARLRKDAATSSMASVIRWLTRAQGTSGGNKTHLCMREDETQLHNVG